MTMAKRRRLTRRARIVRKIRRRAGRTGFRL